MVDRNGLSEINYIINNMDEELKDKIPQSFKRWVKDNMNNDYIIHLTCEKKLVEQELLSSTKILIAVIFKEYLCIDKEEKEKYIKEKNEIYLEEEAKKLSYEINFKEKNKQINKNNNQFLPVEQKTKENIFKKILKYILKIFKKDG